MSAPATSLRICSGVRLDNRYTNTIYFETLAEQSAFFQSKVVRNLTGFTHLRQTWDIKVAGNMSQARKWDYLFFENPLEAADGSLSYYKKYYYFITRVEYVNDSTVKLFLEMDVMQTYLFDFYTLPSFIERCHTRTDAVGDNTVEEGLDVGELTCDGMHHISLDRLAIMVMCSTNPEASTEAEAVPALPYMYNDVFSGIKLWAVDPSDWVAWGNQLDVLDEIGKTDTIHAMWMYPKSLIKLGGEDTWDSDNLCHVVEGSYNILDANRPTKSLNITPASVDGYTPKNKKLLTYPYNFLYCTNNQGTNAVYRYERFGEAGKQEFVLSGSVSPDGGVHMTPLNYNGIGSNYHEGMTVTGFPSCAWDSDVYKLWLAQNQGQLTQGYVTAGLKILGGAALAIGSAVGGTATALTGVGAVAGGAGVTAGAGMAVAGINQISSMLAQNHDKEITPPQANGAYSASVNVTDDRMGFTMYCKCVTAERARILDDFFTMYGYKVNRVEKPYMKTRPAFTYVKTVGCNIGGQIGVEDRVKIASIFDNGVTFWVDGNKIGDYTQDNTPT